MLSVANGFWSLQNYCVATCCFALGPEALLMHHISVFCVKFLPQKPAAVHFPHQPKIPMFSHSFISVAIEYRTPKYTTGGHTLSEIMLSALNASVGCGYRLPTAPLPMPPQCIPNWGVRYALLYVRTTNALFKYFMHLMWIILCMHYILIEIVVRFGWTGATHSAHNSISVVLRRSISPSSDFDGIRHFDPHDSCTVTRMQRRTTTQMVQPHPKQAIVIFYHTFGHGVYFNNSHETWNARYGGTLYTFAFVSGRVCKQH